MHDRDRFATLDGMRGIAAFVVAASHIGLMVGLQSPPHADLAVDFFFVLSGFVIAHAYEDRLHASMTPLEFMRARIIRLHPLILLGSGISFIALLTGTSSPRGRSLLQILWAAVAAVLFIPYHQLAWDAAFPLDGPAWSLFAEYAVNILFALLVVHLTPKRLRAILLLGIAMLVLLFAVHGTVGNLWQMHTIALSLLRVVFPFFAGVLASRIYRSGDVELPSLSPWVSICALLVILLAPSSRFDGAFEFSSIVLVFPLLVLASARDNLGPAGVKVMLSGGALSYPLYILHSPIASIIAPMLQFLTAGAAIAATLLAVLTVSVFSLHFYDEPVRKWVSSSFTLRAVRRVSV